MKKVDGRRLRKPKGFLRGVDSGARSYATPRKQIAMMVLVRGAKSGFTSSCLIDKSLIKSSLF
jgi:hypothetical protein